MPSPSLLYTQMLVTQLQTRDTRGLRPTRPKSQVSQDTTASSPRRQHEHDSWCTLPPCRTGTSLHPLVACVNTACMHEPIQSSICRRHVCLCLSVELTPSVSLAVSRGVNMPSARHVRGSGACASAVHCLCMCEGKHCAAIDLRTADVFTGATDRSEHACCSF